MESMRKTSQSGRENCRRDTRFRNMLGTAKLEKEAVMPKTLKNFLGGAIVCVVCMLLVLNMVSLAQEKEQEKQDDAKILAEIEGRYEFEYEGEFIVFVFSVENGKLMGAPEGEVQEAMEPVAGEEMTFIGYSPEGDEFRFVFKRDAEGKITKCTASVPAMGIEVEGTKIKD